MKRRLLISRLALASAVVAAEARKPADGRFLCEKVVEIHFAGGLPVRNGDQFGIGRAR